MESVGCFFINKKQTTEYYQTGFVTLDSEEDKIKVYDQKKFV